MSEQDRLVFSQYIKEISQAQRNVIADRIEGLAHHQRLGWHYLIGCIGASTAGVLLAFKWWGPRHIFRNSLYFTRPIPPAVSMGVVLYGITYTCRGMLMRNKICMAIEDCEYEIKRVKGHHCQYGITQLAWLQFVLDQVKQGSEYRFDFEKLRQSDG